jgi:hypothetical protein
MYFFWFDIYLYAGRPHFETNSLNCFLSKDTYGLDHRREESIPQPKDLVGLALIGARGRTPQLMPASLSRIAASVFRSFGA